MLVVVCRHEHIQSEISVSLKSTPYRCSYFDVSLRCAAKTAVIRRVTVSIGGDFDIYTYFSSHHLSIYANISTFRCARILQHSIDVFQVDIVQRRTRVRNMMMTIMILFGFSATRLERIVNIFFEILLPTSTMIGNTNMNQLGAFLAFLSRYVVEKSIYAMINADRLHDVSLNVICIICVIC